MIAITTCGSLWMTVRSVAVAEAAAGPYTALPFQLALDASHLLVLPSNHSSCHPNTSKMLRLS